MTIRQPGGAIGLTALGAVVGARVNDLTVAGRTGADAPTGGCHLAFLAAGGFAPAAPALGAALLGAVPPAGEAPPSGTTSERYASLS